ncbi:MAG: hypothetical protein ACRDV3_06275 [Acidothermaceae bacterium]
MNALVAGTAAISPRLGDLGVRRDRLVNALLGYRTSLWDRDEAATGAKVGTSADAHVDAATERARARERIRAVQSVKARRRRQKLGVVGGRRMP